MKKFRLYMMFISIVSTYKKYQKDEKNKSQSYNAIDKKEILSRAYEPVGGSIKNTYSFTVQRGYSFVKVWVKALSNSSDIDFTIKQGSVAGTTIASYSVLKGTSLSKIFEAPTVGTYVISFNASGSMKGQFSVKVGTDFSELNS